MDSYIVRIYRRDRDDPARVVGVVEVVARQELKRFTSLDELNGILVRTRKVFRGKRKPTVHEDE